MSRVYIGIGSNLGNRQENIDRALEKLKSKKNIQLNKISPAIETEPVGNTEQPKFLNACCGIDTTLYPDELLSVLKSIEREMGRGRDSAPKKLSVEEQLKALEDGRGITRTRKDSNPSALPETGRDKGPRIIDLDILLYDDIIMKGNNLVIPHKLMHERLFVLEPLSHIAPEIMHPVLKKTIKELLSGCREESMAGTDKPAMAVKEADSYVKVPVVTHSEHNFPRTLLGIVCRLLSIPYPRSKPSEPENRK